MGDQIIRLRNVLVLAKNEATEGVDAAPVAGADAIPFEVDSLTIGSPYTTEESTEATGTSVAGAPIMIGQPVSFSLTMRLKGAKAGTVYTAVVKPPAHALLQSAGLRGQFTAGVAATAITAGTATSATLGAAFAAVAQSYRGMRAVIGGGAQANAMPTITDYSAGKLAALSDLFPAALTVANTVEIKPNWTYAATSPATTAERVADQPSSTIYAYEDGILYKLFALRGSAKFSVQTARPGMIEISGTAIWGGQSDAAMAVGAAVANHAAPVLANLTAVSNSFALNRKPLPISQFSFDVAWQAESYEDPNTPNGFGAAQLGGRAGLLECDPLKTQLSVRNHLSDLENGVEMVGVARAGSVSGTRWSMTFPQLIPVSVANAARKGARSETLTFRALSPGRDSVGRDGDFILCFD